MNTQRRTAGAVVATLTALLLNACSADSTSTTGEQSPPPSESSTAGPSSAGPSSPAGTPEFSIVGPTSRADLEPGLWAVTAAGSGDVPLAVLDLPAGLNGGAEYIWSLGGAPENDGWIFGYWTVDDVYFDPCTRKDMFGTMEFKFPDIWVEALAAQRRTTTSDPVPVKLGGYHGVYVELNVPTGLDYSTCQENGLTIFDTAGKGDHHVIDTPGVVERYWALNVDGERVVLMGAVTPETTDSQVEQLTAMIESVQFERS